MKRTLSLLLLISATCWAQAQPAPPPPPLNSPEVHADGSVTFRFRDPNAHDVMLTLEGSQPVPMQKDDQGVWTLTTAALAPDFYGYSFVADGIGLIDPSNPLMKPNLLHTQSQVHVPGPASLPWEIADVPHGLVHHHFYKSGVVGDQRDFFVYTRQDMIRGRSAATRCCICCTASATMPPVGPRSDARISSSTT
jgi:hypothetical protein